MLKHIGYALITLLIFLSVGQSLKSQTSILESNFGGMLNEMGSSCEILPDSNIIVLGTTFSYGSGLADIYLVKTDYLGNPIWARQYGGDSTDFGYDIQMTSDGGFIIIGNTTKNLISKDVYLIKVDSLGIVEWEKTFGGTGNDDGRSVRKTFDNGFIITGTTNSSGNGYNDVYLIKTDSLGNLEWEKNIRWQWW